MPVSFCEMQPFIGDMYHSERRLHCYFGSFIITCGKLISVCSSIWTECKKPCVFSYLCLSNKFGKCRMWQLKGIQRRFTVMTDAALTDELEIDSYSYLQRYRCHPGVTLFVHMALGPLCHFKTHFSNFLFLKQRYIPLRQIIPNHFWT